MRGSYDAYLSLIFVFFVVLMIVLSIMKVVAGFHRYSKRVDKNLREYRNIDGKTTIL